MEILVTGCAGFIGYHLCQTLAKQNDINIIGIDNLNQYYDVNLKKSRLENLKQLNNFTFYQIDIADRDKLQTLTHQHANITHIAHLAAQAGVRYSLENPYAYGESNLIGHLNMLEVARNLENLQNFVYASSSSVYGKNTKLPFSILDRVDSPISLYAATKRATELMSHSYSHLYQIPTTGLRFFTVYGPWGRPDMSAFIFTKAILNNEKIPLFNQGNMKRNFTYIDDIIAGTISAIRTVPKEHYKIYNIGNDKAENLLDFVQTIEEIIGTKAQIELMPMQPGDVAATVADISQTMDELNYKPTTDIKAGLTNFITWYKDYYKVGE